MQAVFKLRSAERDKCENFAKKFAAKIRWAALIGRKGHCRAVRLLVAERQVQHGEENDGLHSEMR